MIMIIYYLLWGCLIGFFFTPFMTTIAGATKMCIRSSKSHYSIAKKTIAIALLLFILIAVFHSIFLCSHSTQNHEYVAESCCTSNCAIPLQDTQDTQDSDNSTTENEFCAFCLFLKAHLLLPVLSSILLVDCIPNVIVNNNGCSNTTKYYWAPSLPRPPPFLVYS